MKSSVPRTRSVDSAFARLGRWRDLRLPVKLALVTLVPMLVLLALGGVLIDGQLANAGQYARADRIARLSASVRVAIVALQTERQQVATDAATGASSPELVTARQEVDTALAATSSGAAAGTAAGDLDPVATDAWTDADRQLASLRQLRADSADATATGSADVAAYTELVDALFAFDRVLSTEFADAQLTRQALSLYDLFAAREEVQYQQAVVLAGIGRHTMSVSDVTSLHGSEARLDSRISDFRAVASPDIALEYQRTVDPVALGGQNMLLGQAIDQSGGMTGQMLPGMMISVPVTTWNAANKTVTDGLDTVTDDLAATLSSGAESLRASAGDAAATAIIVLLAAIAATVLLVVVIARQLVRSIGTLRRTAMDVAARRLPDAVERITAGEAVDVGVEPVGVHTRDEVGQLARAFDAVHGEALRLAVAQANLRANYSELFVNLSRRSQSLVQRQLRLIEQLERDEEDPDQLGALFKLDHLATRMRRNNENLMVLSGNELARNGNQQVSLADLLRAAVSEIEFYQRVVVQPPPDVHVVGYAAGDVGRLMAELLDNATAFSAPETSVTVASHRTRRGAVVIDIVDHGIGMSDDELVRANEQLGRPAGVEGRISRRMGLFVISRLAHQHDIKVRLHGGQDIPGLRVTITLPAELVVGEQEQLPPSPDPSDNGGGGGPHNGVDGLLPKRTAGATTAHNGAWHNALRGTLETATPLPGTVLDASANAMTVIIPVLPSAESSGVALFQPLSDEDDPDLVGSTGEAAADTERTPIFDTMISAWFEATPREQTRDGWRFAADEGWHAVDAVIEVEPAEFTAAGLPKRQPKALLLPGSVPLEQQTTVRPPADRVRDRMSGFQDGLRRAKHEQVDPAAPKPWTSAGDDGWRAVDELGEPGDFTSAGLPRRTPKANLLPGSIAPTRAPTHAGVPERDADGLRDRLNSFQRGVRSGRGGESTALTAPVEHGFHW